jgi:probable F420-dependent oxidoreductase
MPHRGRARVPAIGDDGGAWVDIGILTLGTTTSTDVAVLARRAEELGFHSLWVPEHPVVPVHTRQAVPELYRHFTDPFVALSRASAVTTRLKLGTAVCLVPEHHPLVLAKEIASLDMYSGGRFLFGVGAGWLREESEVMGGDFDHRWTQTIESIRAMKELWTNEVSEFHGRYYGFPPVYHGPKPVSRPHPPVLLGSRSPRVFERIVADADGWIPIDPSPAEIESARATLDALAQAAGRDPALIQIVADDVDADRQRLADLSSAGSDVAVLGPRTPDRQWTVSDLDRAAGAVL